MKISSLRKTMDVFLMKMGVKNGCVREEDGSIVWYKDGFIHRDDGPAKEYPDGTKYWYKNGQIHREDGYAFINHKGTKIWYAHGRMHRLEGPALEGADGYKEWWVHGKKYDEQTFNSYFSGYSTKKMKA